MAMPQGLLLRGAKRRLGIYRTSGNTRWLTVIACVSVSGQCIPPFVIFDAKRLNMEWRNGEVVGMSYGLSSNGWVDSELFIEAGYRSISFDMLLVLIPFFYF